MQSSALQRQGGRRKAIPANFKVEPFISRANHFRLRNFLRLEGKSWRGGWRLFELGAQKNALQRALRLGAAAMHTAG